MVDEKRYWNTIQYVTVIERKCEFQCIFWFPIERYGEWRISRKWGDSFDFQLKDMDNEEWVENLYWAQ